MFQAKNVTSDCFTKQKFILNCFGLLHNENVFRQVYRTSLLISLTIYLFSVFPEIFKVYDVDFEKFVFHLLFEIGLLTCLFCMYLTFWNRFDLKQLFEKLQLLEDLSNFKNPGCENVFIKEYKDAVRKQELDVKLIEKKTPDWKSFQIQLQQIIPYHVGIIDAANQMETVFSFITLIVFGGLSICMCLLIYHTQLNIEIVDTVKDVNLLAIGYSIMIIISSYGEDVATESSKIASACYELDFVGSDLRIQKSLILIMAISQRPITPTIGKMKVLGLSTMLNILQSIYSYYNILRNVINERN